jgi:hypothetical protein
VAWEFTMTNKYTRLLIFILGLVAASGLPLAAWAATTVYEAEETLILDGYVKRVDWSGSKLLVIYHSNDGYDGADWTLEGPAPEALLRMGWSKELLKANDRPNAVIYPATDGKAAKGSLVRVQLRDGRTMETGLYGVVQTIPRAHLNRRFENPADDPMQTLYGNTQVFTAEDPKGPPEANYNGRVWFNADHSLQMFSNDLQQDGKTWTSHAMKGTWWLEKQLGKWVRCNWFEPSPIPFCHSPGEFRKVGEKWSIVFRGAKADWIEKRAIEVGQH